MRLMENDCVGDVDGVGKIDGEASASVARARGPTGPRARRSYAPDLNMSTTFS